MFGDLLVAPILVVFEHQNLGITHGQLRQSLPDVLLAFALK